MSYRKYKCPYCEFATIQSGSVTQHVTASHPGYTPDFLTFSNDDLEKKIQENIIKFGEFPVPTVQKALVQPRASPTKQAVKNITKKYTTYSSVINIIQRKSQLGVNKKRKYVIDEAVRKI